MSDSANRFRSVLKTIGASLVGIFIGVVLSASASVGLQTIFPEDDVQSWGMVFWGEHWLLRLSVSFTSTILGAFIVGLIAQSKAKLAGILSATPTVLLFVGGGIVLLFNPEIVESPSIHYWLTFILGGLLSVPLAIYAAEWGSFWREEHKDLFNQPNRPLGVHWSTLIWIWFPYYLIFADLWYSFYYLARLSFVDDWRFVLIIGRALLYLAFFCQGYGLLQGLWYLVSGKHQGLSKLGVVKKVLLYVLCLPVLGVGLRAGGFMILSVNERLPSWLYFIFRLFTAT